MAMPSIVLTQTGAGASTYAIPDWFQNPFNIGLQAVVTGTVSSFAVQYTLDDTTADGYVASSGNWNAVPSMTGLSATTWGTLTVPCRGIRINITTGTGTVTLNIQQAGTR